MHTDFFSQYVKHFFGYLNILDQNKIRMVNDKGSRIFRVNTGHIARNPDFVACEHQRRRSDCATAQSDLRLCCSFPEKKDNLNLLHTNFQYST